MNPVNEILLSKLPRDLQQAYARAQTEIQRTHDQTKRRGRVVKIVTNYLVAITEMLRSKLTLHEIYVWLQQVDPSTMRSFGCPKRGAQGTWFSEEAFRQVIRDLAEGDAELAQLVTENLSGRITSSERNSRRKARGVTPATKKTVGAKPAPLVVPGVPSTAATIATVKPAQNAQPEPPKSDLPSPQTTPPLGVKPPDNNSPFSHTGPSLDTPFRAPKKPGNQTANF